MSAVLGGQRSGDAVGYLTTPPPEDAMSSVDVQVKVFNWVLKRLTVEIGSQGIKLRRIGLFLSR